MEVISLPVAASTNGGPLFPGYCSLSKRINSFQKPSNPDLPNPSLMAKSGFFLSSNGVGVVVCFYCGVTLYDWSRFDSPWLEHAIHSAGCAFLTLNQHNIQHPNEQVRSKSSL